jgi:hypothetical protein
MMRKVFGGVLVAVLFTFAGVGHAVTFTDVYESNYFLLSYWNQTRIFEHNINDDGFEKDFHTITSATMELTFCDDIIFCWDVDSFWDGTEKVNFTFDGSNEGTQEIDTGTIHFFIDTQLLQSDGKVEVKLTWVKGDVYFDQSTLTAQATPIANPEPGSLLLLGSGLSGLGFIGRRRLRAVQGQAL